MVRRLYAQFRRALREPEDLTSEDVLTAVRYAAGAMAMLVASPDYPDVRASDRAVLRELRERALRWARGDRSVATGLNLLADVRTCGDLLRGINRRQELVEHDAALIERLLATWPGDLVGWLANVEPLITGLITNVSAPASSARTSASCSSTARVASSPSSPASRTSISTAATSGAPAAITAAIPSRTTSTE